MMCDTPRLSKISIEPANVSGGGPAVAVASRFMSNVMFSVAVAGRSVPTGIVISPVGPFVSTTPFSPTHPCTRSPVAVSSAPVLLTCRFPPRP